MASGLNSAKLNRSVFITSTGSFLPGTPIDNECLERYLGTIEGEELVRRQVLAMNGIRTRHYALDADQNETHSVYQLGALAARACLNGHAPRRPISYLSAGTTHAPFSGPGLSSILHSQLAGTTLLSGSVEVNSNAGICTASATGMINACRAIQSGAHQTALCIGTEQSTQALKSTAFRVVRDAEVMQTDLKRSQWFMSIFLRFMLSDGAGAWLLESEQPEDRPCFRVDWTHARSYAHEAPLCMHYDNRTARLSQDVNILSKYLFVCARKFVDECLKVHQEVLDDYQVVLPHLSSFFFRGKMERLIKEMCHNMDAVPRWWTNLATAGNTGAASIFIMLDEYLRTQASRPGERILLFIPESGQFNFVMISLTRVHDS
jgi:3-oxoacyl-[acyl-carrier-protein] synthase-3